MMNNITPRKKINEYVLKQSEGLDWNFYVQEFPERYLKESKLDFELHKIVSDMMQSSEFVRILDVGGGPNFTPALRRLVDQSQYQDSNITLHLLDPFVKIHPASVKHKIDRKQVDWDYIQYNVAVNRNSDPGYDLIVCRGSLNYLTENQIFMLGSILRTDGMLIANSFAEPVEISRKIVTGSGTHGTEACVYRKEQDGTVMEHKLIVGNDIVMHESYYHNPTDVIQLLGPEGVSLEFYGRNSVLYKYIR